MLAYYILFALIIILSTLNISVVYQASKCDAITARKKTYATEVFILLTLFIGLRATTVGCDVIQYANKYKNSANFIGSGFSDSEWGYKYLSYFFHDILKVDFQIFLFFLAIIFSFAVSRCVYKYSNNDLMSFVIYLTLGTFTISLSGLRQTLAISLVLLSIEQAEKRKLIKFLLLVFVASIIHNSAIIFLPIYFLWGLRITRVQSFIILGGTVAAFAYKNLLTPIINFLAPERYDKYDLSEGYEINLLVVIVPILMTLFAAVLSKADEDGKLDKKHSFFYILSCLNVFMLILSLNNNQLGRLSYYFSIGCAIIVPATLKKQNINKVWVKITEMIIVFLCLLYFFVSTPDGTLQIDNYKFFWQS